MTPLVLVMVGTDHHPFNRLVEWTDAAARLRPHVRFFVQHGASRPPTVAEGQASLTAEELALLSREAAVFVCHGGPGLIMEGKEAGHVPICVPRDPALGEHVDDHQILFSRRVGQLGVVHRVTVQADLEIALEELLGSSGRSATPRRVGACADAAALAARARLGEELDRLLQLGAGSRRRWRRSGRASDASAVPVQLSHHPLRGHQPAQDQEREDGPRLEREIS